MRLGEGRVQRQRRFVGRDRRCHLTGFGLLDTPLEQRAGILAQGGDRGRHGIFDRRPPRAELRMLCERGFRLVRASEGPIRAGQRVVRRAELRKERDGALQVLDGLGRTALARRNSAQAELHRRRAYRVGQLGEPLAALLEVARIEQGLGQFQPGRQIRRRAGQRLAQGRDGEIGPCQPLQHQASR